MSLKSAFTTAWTEFKSTLTKMSTFVTAEAPKVQAVVQTGSAMLEAADPGLAPLITVGDSIEQVAMGELLSLFKSGAAVVNAATGQAAITLSAGLSTSIQALVGTLEGHPAVVAALAPAPATA
jgi:hypothetical protein